MIGLLTITTINQYSARDFLLLIRSDESCEIAPSVRLPVVPDVVSCVWNHHVIEQGGSRKRKKRNGVGVVCVFGHRVLDERCVVAGCVLACVCVWVRYEVPHIEPKSTSFGLQIHQPRTYQAHNSHHGRARDPSLQAAFVPAG
jgi:hypothetical protein